MTVTIGGTHGSGLGIAANCLDCQRGRELDLPALIARYGADCPPKMLPLRCSRCGSRRFSVTIYSLKGPKGAVARAPAMPVHRS